MRRSLLLWVLLVPALPCAQAASHPAFDVEGGCEVAVCEWSIAGVPMLPETGWIPETGEVAPAKVRVDGLSLEIENASRAGTFFLMSPALVAPQRGVLSVTLRSSGDLGRFPFIVRETRGTAHDASPTDTLLIHPATSSETFASWEWTKRDPDSTHVRIMLRGEVAAGATAGISFSGAYFGGDVSRWFIDDESQPFAVGPRAAWRAQRPGAFDLKVESAEGVHLRRVEIPAAPPAVVLAIERSPALLGGVRIDARGVTSPFHPDLVANGAFDRDLAGWVLTRDELGPETVASWDAGALRLDLAAPTENATTWALQRVRVEPGVPLELQWRASDDRMLDHYEIVVLDGEAGRHEQRRAPGGRGGTGGVLHVTPRTPLVEIQLRVVVMAATPVTVRFDDVVLRRALDVEWRVAGSPIPDHEFPFLDVALVQEIAPDVEVRVRDAFGGETTRRVESSETADRGEVELRLRRQPLVSVVGRPALLDATPTGGRPEFDLLATPVPWAGWRLDDEESPGVPTLALEAGVLEVKSGPSPETFGAGVLRHRPPPPADRPHELAFEHRSEGGIDRVEALARYHGRDGTILSERRGSFAAAPAWSTAAITVPPAPAGAHDLVLSLRAVFRHDEGGTVQFMNATFAPAVEHEWVNATPARGSIASVVAAAPGAVEWSATSVTPGGAVLRTTGTVVFVEPSAPFPTVGSGVAATWDGGAMPDSVIVELDGPTRARVGARSGRVETPSFAPGEYDVVAISPSGHRASLGRGTFAAATGLPPAFEWPEGARAAPWSIDLPLPNPELERVALELTSPLGQSYVIPLARNATTSAWQGAWAVPRVAFPGSFDAKLLLEDEHGARAAVEAGAVRVAVAPGDPGGLAVVAVVLAVALALMVRSRRAEGAR